MGKKKQKYIVSGSKEYQFNTSDYKIDRTRRRKVSKSEKGGYNVAISGINFQGTVVHNKQNKYSVEVNGNRYDFLIDTELSYKRKVQRGQGIDNDDFIQIKSPMPGKIVALFVEKGAIVKKGEPLLILEAMKMQNQILATGDALVENIVVKENETVLADQLLIELKR